MLELADVLLPLTVLVVFAVGGFALAWWRDVRSQGAPARVLRGGSLTVPVLVSVGGAGRRALAVLDDGRLTVVGPRTHLLLEGSAYLGAARRRHRLDEETFDFATQRGFVDASGTRYLLGVVEEWEPALETALRSPARPAPRWRRVAAATPRTAVGGAVAALLALLVFQVVWAGGADVAATMVRVVGDEGYETCAVRWTDGGEPRYAEVDCYPPFAEPGAPLRVRALAFPFEGAAMDLEGTYEGLTTVLGGLALACGAAALGTAVVRLRRPAVRLVAASAPVVELSEGPPVRVDHRASFLTRLDALARVEGWREGATAAPDQPWHQPYRIALGAGRWWPVPVLVGIGVFVVEIPYPVRVALVGGGAVAGLWAAASAARTWRALRPAYSGPVTSEWDYRLVRTPDEEWFVLLVLGERPHWIVPLPDEQHPAPAGRCGVRGDLRDGGAVQLRIDGSFWMTAGVVERVDDELLGEIDEDVRDRLRDLGRRPG